MFLDGERKSFERSGYGIVGYIGPNGSGKSLMAVQDSLHSLRQGRPVVSTVRLLDWQNSRPCDDDGCDFPGHPDHQAAHPLWVPFRNWGSIIGITECDVLMDEVTGVANSRDGMALPSEIQNLLMQLRRADVVLRWTAPSWARADRIIRETTQIAVVCRGMFPQRLPGAKWRVNRMVRAKALDARDLDDLTQGVRQTATPLLRSFALVSRIEARLAYDTLDHVMSLPSVEGGRCPWCAKRRRVEACSCSRDAQPLGDAQRAGAPSGVGEVCAPTADVCEGDTHHPEPLPPRRSEGSASVRINNERPRDETSRPFLLRSDKGASNDF